MLPTLFRRRPAVEASVTPFTRDIDAMFDEFADWWRGNGLVADAETAAYPVDIREEDGQILVDAEMPGFEKNEVDVTLENGVLSISAEHKEESKTKRNGNGKTHLHERRYRRIERSFTLPASVDQAKVDATLKDGVLHLKLQKAKEASKNKITVK